MELKEKVELIMPRELYEKRKNPFNGIESVVNPSVVAYGGVQEAGIHSMELKAPHSALRGVW